MKELFILLILFLVVPACAEDIFIEAESSPAHTFSEVAAFENIVSGGKILRLFEAADPPAEGYCAKLPFKTDSDGRHHIWIAASVPGGTSNFWWKLDEGEWNHYTLDTLKDFYEAYGVSGVMGWMRLDSLPITKGDHTLTIRVNERRISDEHGYIMYLDAVFISTRFAFPRGLVTPADVPNLQPRAVPPTPVKRAGKPGPRQMLGSSIMEGLGDEIMTSIGFTLLMSDSDHLTVNETEPGKWDWTKADAGFAEARRVGAKWQYFPHFHWPPEWYRNSDKYVPTTGLRTKRKLACMSIWSPNAQEWLDHCYTALAEHYGSDNKKLAAIYLGVHGDFGETLFPMGWHPLEKQRFGPEGEGAPDFWCGDPYARADFRKFAQERYGSLDKINSAWGTKFESLRKVDYPPCAYGTSSDVTSTTQIRRYWLDFYEWFNGSMTRFVGDVCRIARKHFPNTLLKLPVGGGEEAVVYAQDNSAQVKVASEYGVQVRSTHGGYLPFPQNCISPLKRLSTAAKFYKVPFWTEAPGNTSAKGAVTRFMENICCGNFGYWDWSGGPVGASDTFREYSEFLTTEKPVVDAALFFPMTDHRLHPEIGYPRRLSRMGADLRDVMDYDVVDELLINDGALKGYRVMFWLQGEFIEAKTLASIAKWVERGGILVKLGTALQTVEGTTPLTEELLGLASGVQTVSQGSKLEIIDGKFLRHVNEFTGKTADLAAAQVDQKAVVLAKVGDQPAAWALRRGKGWIIVWAGAEEKSQAERTFYELSRDVVYNISALDAKKSDAREIDTAWDGVYTVLLANGEAILHNFGDEPQTKSVAGTEVTLPPYSLRSVMAR